MKGERISVGRDSLKQPRIRKNGLPFCHEQIVYLLQCAGGSLTRGQMRDTLMQMGYSYYGVYEAFRRLSDNGLIVFDGSGHSPNQIIQLKNM